MTTPSQAHPGGTGLAPTAGEPGRTTSPRAVLLAAVVILGVGVGLGFGYYSLGFSHPRGAAFKFLVGLPLGLVGLVLLYPLRVPPRYVLALAGLGCVAALSSIHYFGYRDIPDAWGRELADVALARQVEGLHETIRATEAKLDEARAAERERPNARRHQLIEGYEARLKEMREK